MNKSRELQTQPPIVIPSQQAITIRDLAADALLDQAFDWLCQRRQDWPTHADVWRFRRDWLAEKTRIQTDLLAGNYEIGMLDRVIRIQDGQAEEIDLWPARDALVTKALALLLSQHLPLSKRCTHLKGHGGAKFSVRQVLQQLPHHRFVLKTDVQSYYASIAHKRLLEQFAVFISDERILNLISQALRRNAERGGLVWEHRQGIALGSPLSPIIGAFFLMELDKRLDQLGLFWTRFMDDILVLAPTRWKLRQAVRVVNQVLATLGLAKHPAKTFIGRIANGFEFLGYHFRPDHLAVAHKTLEQFVVRMHRLYECEPGEPQGPSRLGAYVQRWWRWVHAGLPKSITLYLPEFRDAVTHRMTQAGSRLASQAIDRLSCPSL